MQIDQALSIARSRLSAQGGVSELFAATPYAAETREVLATLEQIQTDLQTGVLVYAKDAPD